MICDPLPTIDHRVAQRTVGADPVQVAHSPGQADTIEVLEDLDGTLSAHPCAIAKCRGTHAALGEFKLAHDPRESLQCIRRENRDPARSERLDPDHSSYA